MALPDHDALPQGHTPLLHQLMNFLPSNVDCLQGLA